jgi:BMFP domain-containing protein YqiC
MPKNYVSRRLFLKGAGVSLALPILEASIPPNSIKGEIKKPVKRFVCLSNNYGVYQKAFFPEASDTGIEYTMPETLTSLEKHRKEITLFQNLDHGFTGGHAGVPVLLSGVRPILAHNFQEGNISLDQKLAEYYGSATRFPSMTLNCRERNLLSFTRTGVQIPSISMQQAYRSMFIEEATLSKASKREQMTRQNSILDVVREQANDFQRKLGSRDRTKLEEYFDSVRTLEKKIQQQEPWLDRPKPKAPVDEPKPGNGTEEQLRAMIEIIALALKTDSTRAITCVSGFVNGDFGLNGGYHGFSHHGEREELVSALKKIEGFQISMMSYLIDLLKKEEDLINGGSLFDNTSILYGCGMATGTHSTRNLPLVLAGGGFKHGEHKVYPEEDGKRVPAANLLLSILQSCGLEIDQFGASTGTLSGLEWT